MGVRKERGPGGMGRVVIDRRPQKSVPIRSQYREFGGRVERDPNFSEHLFALVMLISFLSLATLLILASIVSNSSVLAFGLALGVAMGGAGYFLRALMHGRENYGWR